jgi:DME family drug/metabolite transporter
MQFRTYFAGRRSSQATEAIPADLGGHDASRRRRGDTYAALTAVGYGSAYVATAFALRSFEPIAAAAWRGTLAAFGLAALLAAMRPARIATISQRPSAVTGGAAIRLTVLSLLGGPIFYLCMNLAVASVGPTISAFVAGLYAILAALLAPALLGERLRPTAVAAFVLALVGTAMLSDVELARGRPEGVAWALAAAISFALFLVLARRWSVAHALPGHVVALGNAVATALVLGTVLVASAPAAVLPAPVRWDSALALAWLAVVAAAGQVLAVLAVRLIPAERSSAFLLLNPLTAAVLAWLLLGATPTPLQAVGCALVLVAMAAVGGWLRPPTVPWIWPARGGSPGAGP